MATIGCAIMLLLACLTIAKCLIYINKIDKRIDNILAEEKRQNKRIDVLEKRELIRQSEQRRDKAWVEANEFFSKW